MVFLLLKMRYYFTLTLPQNGGNRVSEDLKSKNFPGEDGPETPYRGTTFGDPFRQTPFLKTWIRARS